MRKQTVDNYAYTMGAARKRMQRGATFVYVMQPLSGRLLRVTRNNWKTMLREFRMFTHIIPDIATAMATAHTLRGWTLDNAPGGYVNTARALVAFCDKRDLTLRAVYVGNTGSGYIRAVVIRSDGMARRVYWYCGAWNYANTRIVPIQQLRINKYHVTV